jgi:hypothetical protein
MSLNFQNIKGDTFEQVNFEVKINGDAVDLTDAVIRMQLRKEYGGVVGLSLTSVANAGITITDAVNGLFKINKQVINIPPYNYIYDIEIHFDNGDVKTWISGNFQILNDVTR